MKFSLPSLAQANAFGRHVVSYAMGAVTVAVSLSVINEDTGAKIADAVTQIASGVTTAAGGIATLVAILSGIWASWTASRNQQIKAVAADPEVAKIEVTSTAVADAIPSPKVVTQ